MADTLRCFLVTKDDEGRATSQLAEKSIDDLPDGDVLIRVAYSSLNYKDALSATRHGGVTRNYPHVPGIDAARTVAASRTSKFREGDNVLVTGFDLGANTWGGFGEYVRVPENWVVPIPEGLSSRECMIYGTAGFTAALSLEAITHHGIEPKYLQSYWDEFGFRFNRRNTPMTAFQTLLGISDQSQFWWRRGLVWAFSLV